jgi:plastocyanin
MPIIGGRGAGVRGLGFQGAGKPNPPVSASATNTGTSRAFNNGSASVSFSSGGSNGAPISSFTVTSSPGSFTASGASSPLTVTGLQSNTAYTFTVTATNAVGTSDASSASSSITATTVPQTPSAPTVTTAAAGDTVTWTAPATGGSTITGYTWASSDYGKTYICINDEEINDWGVICGSKNLQTMMMTDTVSKNVHVSVDLGYTWTQIYNGSSLDDSVTINSCAVAANSYEGTETKIELALGFSGTSMKVVYGCDPHDEFEHCADRWYDTGDSDADTYSVTLSKNGKYFYSIDSTTMKIAIGTRKNID